MFPTLNKYRTKTNFRRTVHDTRNNTLYNVNKVITEMIICMNDEYFFNATTLLSYISNNSVLCFVCWRRPTLLHAVFSILQQLCRKMNFLCRCVAE